MKYMIIKSNCWILLFVLLFLLSCEKNASYGPFGTSYVYMPQAVSSGSDNLTYIVPSDNIGTAKNYIVNTENNTVDIMLGVSRSGTQPPDAYSVDIVTDQNIINDAISNGILNNKQFGNKKIVILPDNCYNLPSSLDVSDGQTSENFYLSVNIDCLNLYSSRIVALAVLVINPSKFELNTSINKTIVLIDVSKLGLP